MTQTRQIAAYTPVPAWLIPILQSRLAHGTWVGAVWPDADTPPPKAWVAVRDDGGVDQSPVTVLRDLTVTVHAATPARADALAEDVAVVLRVLPYLRASPVAAVDHLSGPTPLTDESFPYLRVFTVSAIVAGTPESIEIGED